MMKKPLMLVLGLITCGANAVIYKKVGDEVVLHPGPVTGPITVITWTHNKDIVAEWSRNNFTFYDPFTDRCKLNTTTGELTISNLTLEDSGSYTAEINNKVLNKTELKVISAVPTPTISTSCDDGATVCFTCEVNTTGAEPVTYSWWSGGVVMKSQTKELKITKKEDEDSFICKVKNPVSSESSKEVLNPFINKNLIAIIIAVLILLGVGVGVGLFLWKRKCKGSQVNLPTNGAADAPVVVTDNEPVQESSSQGPTSPVHLENETEMVNIPLLGENDNTAEKAAETDISRIGKFIQKAGHIIDGELETIV